MIVKNNCGNCTNSYQGYAESSMCYGLRCEIYENSVDEKDTCDSFEMSDHYKLKFQIKQNTELQAKLDLAVEALEYFDEVLRVRKSFKIEELEYKAITTLTEILEL